MEPDRPINEDYEINISAYLREAWEHFKENASIFVIAAIIILVTSAILSSIPRIGGLLNTLVGIPLTGGLFYMALRASIGIKPEIGEILKGFEYFVQLILYSIVSSVLIILGLVIFIVPGIYLAVSYGFTYLLIIDRNMGFWDAMETSRKAITKKWFSFFSLFLVLAIIVIVSSIPLGLGLLVTVPLSSLTIASVYRDVFQVESKVEETPFKELA